MTLLRQRIEDIKKIQKLPKISMDIIDSIQIHKRLSIFQLTNLLGVSRHTIRNHVYQLVHQKYIKAEGSGRSVTYVEYEK